MKLIVANFFTLCGIFSLKELAILALVEFTSAPKALLASELTQGGFTMPKANPAVKPVAKPVKAAKTVPAKTAKPVVKKAAAKPVAKKAAAKPAVKKAAAKPAVKKTAKTTTKK